MQQQSLLRETMRFKVTGRFSHRNAQQGFTLIEVVLVIVLMGVLAIFAAPSFNGSDFNARGFHDQTLALLRYAQKTAIAQRRTVCVSFTPVSVSLAIATTAGISTCATTLAGAGGSSTVTARSGVQFSTVPTAFSFDALGQPTVAQAIQVVNVTPSITVEAVTGFVHE